MTEKRTQEEIENWAKELVLSHGGSVSAKTIRGTVRYYLQWKEQGRYRSKYLRVTEVAAVRHQLALMRGKAVAENPLSFELAKSGDVYETNVCTGKSLLEFAEEARGLLTEKERASITDTLRLFGLPITAEGLDPGEVIRNTHGDKKRRDGAVRFVLLDGIGRGVTSDDVTDQDMADSLTGILL